MNSIYDKLLNIEMQIPATRHKKIKSQKIAKLLDGKWINAWLHEHLKEGAYWKET